jgi:putative DNA primase/helicase
LFKVKTRWSSAMSAPSAYLLSRFRPSRLEWLIEPYLPRGRLAILDGDPEAGKSHLAIDLAARLSRGGPLPTGAVCDRPHTTLFLTAEDKIGDTVRPRAEAAGADLDRLIIALGTDGLPLRLPDQFADLARMVREHRPDLVVVDPLAAFLAAGAGLGTDQCVRRVLQPLAVLAERADCAVLLVRHLRKLGLLKALYRGLGRIEVAGVCRTVLLAARHPTDPDLRVLTVSKANLVGSRPALGYRIAADGQGRSVVVWAGPVDLTAEAVLGRPPAPLRPRDRATDWLRGELASGPRPAAAVLAAAAAAGIPEITLRRAKKDLPAESRQVGRGGERTWYWYDPSAPWPADAPFEQPTGRAPPEPDPLPGLDML